MESEQDISRNATTVGHCQHDDIDVYVGRGPDGASMENTEIGQRGWLGNPFPVHKYGREGCIDKFREAFKSRLASDEAFRREVEKLSGSMLGCWCQRAADTAGDACHGEVIAEWADKMADWSADR